MWKKSELREAPAPLEGPVVGTITGGTIIWFVLFLGQLPFYGWFADNGHSWWVWTCLVEAAAWAWWASGTSADAMPPSSAPRRPTAPEHHGALPRQSAPSPTRPASG